MTNDPEAHASAFNDGSDCRIRGEPCNPGRYVSLASKRAFAKGWRHADLSWGNLARWKVAPLPPVREVQRSA